MLIRSFCAILLAMVLGCTAAPVQNQQQIDSLQPTIPQPGRTLDELRQFNTPEDVEDYAARIRRQRTCMPFPANHPFRNKEAIHIYDDLSFPEYQNKRGALDLKGVQQLTLQQAEVIAETQCSMVFFPDLEVLKPDVARALVASARCPLFFTGLRSLDEDTIRVLIKHRPGLELGVRQPLDVATAKLLSKARALVLWLTFDGVSDDALTELAAYPRQLGITLDTLSSQSAAKLAAVDRNLTLNGPAELTPQAASALAGFKGSLLEINPSKLSPEAARALTGLDCVALTLGGPDTLSPELAREFIRFSKVRLVLSGVKSLEPPAAKVLANMPGTIILQGVPELTPEVARILAQSRRPLVLSGLSTLDVDTARELAQTPSALGLYTLASLEPEVAQALGSYSGPLLALPGITRWNKETAQLVSRFTSNQFPKPRIWQARVLDAESVQVLTRNGGKVTLDALDKVDKPTLEALTVSTSDYLSMRGLKSITPGLASVFAGARCASLALGVIGMDVDSAKALLGFRGDQLSFWDMRILTPNVAALLATWPGESLEFNSLTSIDAATATHLAKFKGKYIDLSRLRALDEASAQALLAFGGDLDVSGLRELNPVSAKLLIRNRREVLLFHLNTLDVATARVLANSELVEIRIIRLRTFPPEIAKEFSAFRGKSLRLDGVRTIDVESVTHLLALSELHLGVTTLTPELAEALAGGEFRDLWFTALESLDVESATKLAAFKGSSMLLPTSLMTNLPSEVKAALAPIEDRL